MQTIPITVPSPVRRNKEKLAQFIAKSTSITASSKVRASQLNRLNRDINKWLVSELDLELSSSDFSEVC